MAEKIIPWIGIFPECGCGYTTADDGIHFCAMHAAAEETLAAAKDMIESLGFTSRKGDEVLEDYGTEGQRVYKRMRDAIANAEKKS